MQNLRISAKNDTKMDEFYKTLIEFAPFDLLPEILEKSCC